MNEPILYKEENNTVHIIFNRPEKKNALTRQMWILLGEYLKEACSNMNTRAILLYGNGEAFSAGDDIREMYLIETLEEAREYFSAHLEAFKTLLNCNKLVSAIVDGPAVGGGAEILLATDIVIASKRSIIGYPEIRIGLIPPVLSTLGVYILGDHIAKRLAITGELMTAEEAYRIGIIDFLVNDANILDEAKRILRQLIALPETSIDKIKNLTRASMFLDKIMNEAIEYLAQQVILLDAKKRMKSFLRK